MYKESTKRSKTFNSYVQKMEWTPWCHRSISEEKNHLLKCTEGRCFMFCVVFGLSGFIFWLKEGHMCFRYNFLILFIGKKFSLLEAKIFRWTHTLSSPKILNYILQQSVIISVKINIYNQQSLFWLILIIFSLGLAWKAPDPSQGTGWASAASVGAMNDVSIANLGMAKVLCKYSSIH